MVEEGRDRKKEGGKERINPLGLSYFIAIFPKWPLWSLFLWLWRGSRAVPREEQEFPKAVPWLPDLLASAGFLEP